jgi:DNA polymerase-3 subunit gamma/tau
LAEAPALILPSFQHVVDLIREKRDMLLLKEVEDGVRLVRYAPGRIEFQPSPLARPDLAARLSQRLQGWTGARWGISVVNEGGAATLAEERDAEENAARAKIADIRTPEAMAAAAQAEALPEVEDEWDPFEDA